MNRFVRRVGDSPHLMLFLASLVWAPVLCRTTHASAADWKFDQLHLKNGKVFTGLLGAETDAEVHFQCVRRRPGAPTIIIATVFKREEIRKIDRLSSQERDSLAASLKALDPNGKGEKQWMKIIDLQTIPWTLGKESGLEYASEFFTFTSNAREDLVRRTAVRLEQIYAAYSRFLPPRRQPEKSTRIYLFRYPEEFRQVLKDRGQADLFHPAFFDPHKNEVFCVSDLQRLTEDWEKVHKKHDELSKKINEEEADLELQYRGKIPTALRSSYARARQEIESARRLNEKTIEDSSKHLFQTLYHEAFHAYLANYVYPPSETEVPRWLNEGLAQIFETAIVEGGELRVGHADLHRLDEIKRLLREDRLIPMADLLRSGSKQFLVEHAQDRRSSDLHYLQSWALAFYLTFEKHLLATPRMDQYCADLKNRPDSLPAFTQLVEKPLPEFEKEFERYLRGLQADGSVAEKKPAKNISVLP